MSIIYVDALDMLRLSKGMMQLYYTKLIMQNGVICVSGKCNRNTNILILFTDFLVINLGIMQKLLAAHGRKQSIKAILILNY